MMPKRLLKRLLRSLLIVLILAILAFSVAGMLLPAVVLVCDLVEKFFGFNACSNLLFKLNNSGIYISN